MKKCLPVFMAFLCYFSFSQNPVLKNIHIPYNSSDIQIDGNLDDWNHYFRYTFADTGSIMHNTPGHKLMAFYDDSYDYAHVFRPLSRNAIEARICWNLNHLYFAFIVEDGHLWAQNIIEGKYPNLQHNASSA